MVTPTWETRDLPVLRAIVEISDEGTWRIDPSAIAARIGLDDETVMAGLWALAKEQPPFFEYVDTGDLGGRDMRGIRDPTGHARRTVGTWPRPEDRVAEMVAALQEAAEHEPDPEKKSALRKAAEYAGGIGRDLFVGIVTNMVPGS